ncbi:MAG: EKC/KEOPS complex subunit CGI121/TPRKB [Candidatus Heimdallarchaeota archaeon]|nr:EKC/KEOPS complex subunit CGI121/TPRKB [Candidatus Heimdallarchaeota archaeon]
MDISDPIYIKDRVLSLKHNAVIFDTRNIICMEQIYFALWRVQRAVKQQNMIAKDWAIEVLLQLSCTNQIEIALQFFNVDKKSKDVIIIQEDIYEEMGNSLAIDIINFNPSIEFLNFHNVQDDYCNFIISKGVELLLNHT